MMNSHLRGNGDFADYLPVWKHNGYWFVDSPGIIQQLAQEHSFDPHRTSLFYYEVYELEFDEKEREWSKLKAELPFHVNVMAPAHKVLEGYDLVSYSIGTNPKCSPLSCKGLAKKVGAQSTLPDGFF